MWAGLFVGVVCVARPRVAAGTEALVPAFGGEPCDGVSRAEGCRGAPLTWVRGVTEAGAEALFVLEAGFDPFCIKVVVATAT